MSEQKIDITEEVAENDFNRFVDAMDLDMDESHMNDEDLAGFKSLKRTITLAIMKGNLRLNDKDEFVLVTMTGKKVVFSEPEGGDFQETDRAKLGQNVEKMHRYLGSMTGLNPALFSKLKARDWKVCNAIGTLFLV